MKQPQPFELKLVGGGSTGYGDYDEGHWEITNGKLSLYTDDCDESDETEDHQFEALLNALNATKAKFWTSDGDRAYGLELERDHYKAEVERLEKLKAAILDIASGKPLPQLIAQQAIKQYQPDL